MKKKIRELARRHVAGVLNALHELRQVRRLEKRQVRETPWGFRFKGHEEMERGVFEAHEAKEVADFARRGGVYVDVGANFGYFVAIARSHGAHVLALEPLQHNLTVLYQNIELNGWSGVEVFPLAVGKQPGLARLYGGSTSASLLRNWAGTSPVWQRTISVSTLDLIIGERFREDPLFIKIDVEGAERQVLEGADRLLNREKAPSWMVEICFRENQPGGEINEDFREIFEMFWRFGYRCRTVWSEAREVHPDDVDRWLKNGERDFGYVNYFFEKRTRE